MARDAQTDLLCSRLVGETVDTFISMKRVEQMSPRTLRYYRDNLQPLRVFVGEEVVISSLTTDLLNRYLMYSVTLRGVVAHRRRYDVLRTFINWLVWMGYFPVSPLKAKPPKVPKRVIVPFTAAEVQMMLDSCTRRATANRDRAMILTLCDSAIRLDELAHMKEADINWKEGQLYVFGKGAKERHAYLSVTTMKAIFRYVHTRRKDSLWVWLSEEGVPLTRSGCQQVIRRLSKRALGRVYGPHKFRHTAACSFLMNGMSADALMRMLGHSSMKQSLEYAEYVRARHAFAEAKKFSMVEREGLK